MKDAIVPALTSQEAAALGLLITQEPYIVTDYLASIDIDALLMKLEVIYQLGERRDLNLERVA